MPVGNALFENEIHHGKMSIIPRILTVCSVLYIFIVLGIGGFFIWLNVRDLLKERTNEQQTTRTVAPLKFDSRKAILLNYFRRIPNHKAIAGICVQSLGKSNEWIEKIQNITGVSPGLISTEMPSSTSNETQWFTFVDEVISNWNNHRLVHIKWWEGNPLRYHENFTDLYRGDEDNKENSWKDLIDDEGGKNKLWKEAMDTIAPYLHKLQTAGVLPIFDILPFINQEYYVWSGRLGVNGSAKLYQITREYLTKQHNLTSLIWNWSVLSYDMTQFEVYWPGSDYVDVASVLIWDKEIQLSEYYRLIDLVGDKPLAMEYRWIVPDLSLLTFQTRWTWFTVVDEYLEYSFQNNYASIMIGRFSYTPIMIHKGNIEFFSDNN